MGFSPYSNEIHQTKIAPTVLSEQTTKYNVRLYFCLYGISNVLLLQWLMMLLLYTAQKFLSAWCKDDEESHPALEVLKRLLKTSDLLSPTVSNFDHSLCVYYRRYSYQHHYKH